MAQTKPNIGRSVYFSAGLPATNDEAGFEALTFTKVEHAVSAPQFGVTHNNIDAPDLESGFTVGLKGAGSGTDSQMSFRIVGGALATGQAALKALADAVGGGEVSLMIGRGTGSGGALTTGDKVVFCQGYVHSYQKNPITVDSYEGFTVNFKANAAPVYGTK